MPPKQSFGYCTIIARFYLLRASCVVKVQSQAFIMDAGVSLLIFNLLASF